MSISHTAAYPGKIRIIGGKWRSRVLKVLDRESLRPTPDRVRETLFNWLAPKIVDARCLDCFAGTGILSFEALSRGAQQVTLIDADRVVIDGLKHSRTLLGAQPQECDIVQHNVMQWFKEQLQKKQPLPYDIIFLDAPFNSDLLEQSLSLLESEGFVSDDTWIYIEMPVESKTSLSLAAWQLLKSKKAGKVEYQLIAKL